MKCIFCYNQQRTKFGKLLWKRIYSIRNDNGLYFYTVCPNCSHHSIKEIELVLLKRKDLFNKRLL